MGGNKECTTWYGVCSEDFRTLVYQSIASAIIHNTEVDCLLRQDQCDFEK